MEEREGGLAAAATPSNSNMVSPGLKMPDGMKEENPITVERGVTQGPNSEESESQPDKPQLDPYEYLKREGFTSEIFKIEVRNLPRKFGFSQLKKRLINLELNPVKIKAASANGSVGYVTFRNEEDRQKGLNVLNGHQWKGQVLQAKKANPAADPFIKRQLEVQQQDTDEPQAKKARSGTDNQEEDKLPPQERLNNVVTPLWQVPYEEQIQTKQTEMDGILKKFAHVIEKGNLDLKSWIQNQRKTHQLKCCTLLEIKPSPILESYRNKCEFTIGKGSDGGKVVGFRMGRYRDGTCVVTEPSGCINLPQSMKDLAKALQDYIQTSKYGVFDPELQVGHYRQLTARTCQGKDLMAIIIFHPQSLTEEELALEKQSLVEYFVSGGGKSCGITSLYFQASSSRVTGGDSEPAFELLHGEQHISEELLGLTFRISPDAFFQVNTLATEVLYQVVGDWCLENINTDVTVLDICCGTGTIGLTLAKRVKKVIGIEMVPQAIEDAKHNAQLNDISNVEFHCGKAEDVLPELVSSRPCWGNAVAVVDPPRAGLHPKVIHAIRRCHALNRVIFVSCSPKSVVQSNFLDFVRPESKKMKGPPFIPVKAIPVDLFPHTSHCELVVLFERYNPG
ncbi:tRNA (uracil-5-)-methyltransferase homolog A [Lingula anatina]|uniref:tRNA (uracil(54)-C(5))-methyltransferase n=1 Tax=Lingula anatina TaxID=7574 RepID=A0A1S3J1N9_LINAN|nr:tRNA (uracil-5-)-methyltransferase homolog A [Lingula anatina]XP_013403740.1 tRNA (uracil-5-)-methyltransferase homolog A [Lingula anatina]|eukprot:XP_013403739.1 tRNA (uracil-5-)-methyltransferase homolog A [Lingula anatina]